jgi:hypothetical protein
MKLVVTAAIALMVIGSPTFAMSDVECTDMWTKADTNGDRVVSGAEADRYSAMMRIGKKDAPADASYSKPLFLKNCESDVFKASSTDAGAPLAGANSFTENQAKDRIIALGLSAPSSLVKDDQGIWRGSATKDGASVQVAVDFKGNVVAQ